MSLTDEAMRQLGKPLERRPFLHAEAFPQHEYALTLEGADWVMTVEERKGRVREALRDLFLTNVAGVVCRVCGLPYWDIIRAEDLAPGVGITCVPRPHIIKAIIETGSNTFGTLERAVMSCELSDSFNAHVKAAADAHVVSAFSRGGMCVLTEMESGEFGRLELYSNKS